jgi:hypothetical protein
MCGSKASTDKALQAVKLAVLMDMGLAGPDETAEEREQRIAVQRAEREKSARGKKGTKHVKRKQRV